jgi:murein L,D-transpeptidase YcbB/YkuD
MRKAVATILLLFCVSVTGVAQTRGELQQRLRNRIEAGLTTDSFDVMDERVYARETLRRVYPARSFEAVWVSDSGPSAVADRFVDWLATEPARHGLRSEHYHLESIESLVTDRVGALVDLELALSDAFLIVASHLLAGRLNPETLDAEWIANRRHRDLAPLLDDVANGADAGEILEQLLPRDPAYHALVEHLARLRTSRDAGGWPQVESGPTLRPGDSGSRVLQLSDRLLRSGDLEDASTSGDFDEALDAAVRAYQRRHGLSADGLVGRATIASLNLPIQDRIDRIIVNLERWRWLPESLGERHVIVNIAGFSLDVVEAGQSIMSMRVVVGRPYRRTPVFSDTIRYLVLNPSWEVPATIATQDKLPLIRQDPDYLSSGGYQLLQGWGSDERVIDPYSVDWASITPRNFPYRLRQGPGPLNALGQIKFMFPNKFSVYLHDTPARELFGEDMRAFSSGCIRLNDPLSLAELLLDDATNWSRDAIDDVIASGREQTVILREPVPVHLLYWTAWAGPDGTLQFRDDIYARDAPVLRELRETPPL